MAESWEFWLTFSIAFIGFLIAFIGFLILLYDHYKDDRQLYEQIKEFYEGIEKIILFYYSELILEKQREETGDPEREKMLKYKRIKKRIKHSYYKEFIKYNSKDCFKYLGLVYSGDNKDKIINKDTYYVLGTEGQLRYKDLRGEPRNINEKNIVNNLMNITSEEIKKINEFLTTLRLYWKEHHYTWLFRPKLKWNINYSEKFNKIYSY